MSQIVHVTDHYIICNKDPGEPSQPGKTPGPSTLSFAEQKTDQSLFVVHRIDQRASGLLLFARTAAAAAQLSSMMSEHLVARRYLAIVSGPVEPPDGVREDRLRQDRKANKSHRHPEGKQARLEYRTLTEGDHYTLLEVTLSTGRHHQIRAQLAAAGWPIRGDVKYGARRTVAGGGICLHACRLELPEAAWPAVTATAPPPPIDIWHSLCPADYLSPANVTQTGG